MFYYLAIDILILILGYFLINRRVYVGKIVIDGNKWFYILTGLVLIFFSSFRGDFTPDYSGYVDIYNRFKEVSLVNIVQRPLFSYPEKGYLLFQFFVKKIFNNQLYIFIVSSIIIVTFNLAFFKQDAENDLLAVMLFLEAGLYYSSFNLMRQMLAASIVVIASKFLYEKKFFPYFVIILIASIIHTSAIIMIPFYFICRIKVEKKGIILFPIILALMVTVLPVAISFVGQYYWGWYYKDASTAVGYSWKNVVLPLAISIFAFVIYLLNRDNYGSDKERKKVINNIWLNASFFYSAFYLLGMQFSLAQRFASFFSTYTLCFFCNQVSRNKYRTYITAGAIIVLIYFGYITKDSFPYYFIWDR